MFTEFFKKFRSLFQETPESAQSKRSQVPKKENVFITRKNQSMKDSQGKNDFSGSGYNGPGNVDHEKRDSNMSQRNF